MPTFGPKEVILPPLAPEASAMESAVGDAIRVLRKACGDGPVAVLLPGGERREVPGEGGPDQLLAVAESHPMAKRRPFRKAKGGRRKS